MIAPLLSILIPTLPARAKSFDRLMRMLQIQSLGVGPRVEILSDSSPGPTGTKRNRLLQQAQGDYVCAVDDDDLVSEDYIARVLDGCLTDADCCSLEGIVHFDRRASKPFHHSMAYPKWSESPTRFERSVNHLNAVKRTLALQAGFPDETVGEDRVYSDRLRSLLRTEAKVPGCLYYYFAEQGVKDRAESLRFLLKFPTKDRPGLFRKTFRSHVEALSGRHPVHFVVSTDDGDMTGKEVAISLVGESPPRGEAPWLDWSIKAGPAGRGKIAAINADIPHEGWDVCVLLADDMVPVEKDWDERIVADMARYFPHLDGVLDYADGFRREPTDPEEVSCVVMPVMGKAYYDRFGYVYSPEYSGLWADVELAEVAKRAGKAKHIPHVIVRHNWIGKAAPDDLLRHNESFFHSDKEVYDRRKALGFPRGSSMSYSQGGEEAVILRELGASKGRLLDIGAHDGATFSNSLRLIEMGWSAVLVEPSPGPFSALLDRHHDNPRVTLVNAAVAAKPGFALFRESTGDMVSTLSEDHARLWTSAGIKWREYLLRTIAPMELLAHVGGQFDLVSIDTEGKNLEVFNAIDWKLIARQGLRMVVVEHEGRRHDYEATLVPLGFEVCYDSAENLIFRRRSA